MGGILFEHCLPNLAGLDGLSLGEEFIRLAEVGRVGIVGHGIDSQCSG
jgi:hypothetical protein